MRNTLRALVLGLAFSVSSIPLIAVVATPAVAQMQVPLTDELVVNFIASYPGVMSAAEAIQAENGGASGEGTPVEAMTAMLGYGDALNKLNAAVTPHGFTDYMQWIGVMSSITTAYAYYREGGGIDTQLAETLKEIEANPSLNADQKKMMIEQLKAAGDAMAANRPPQESIDAINAHAAELDAIFEDM